MNLKQIAVAVNFACACVGLEWRLRNGLLHAS